MPRSRLPRLRSAPEPPPMMSASAPSHARMLLNEEMNAHNESDAAAEKMFSKMGPGVAAVLVYGIEALRQELRAGRHARERQAEDLIATFEEMGRS